MASMLIRKRVCFRLSKSFPHAPSLSLWFSHKAYRVFFASASNYSDWRNGVEGARDSRASWACNSTMAAGRVAEDHQDSDMGERAKETMREGVDKAKERAQEMKERTKEYAEEAKEKAEEGTNRAAEKAREYSNETKEGTERAAETVTSVGDKAKQTVQGAWEAAKDTTHKIKETVVGKDDNDKDERGG